MRRLFFYLRYALQNLRNSGRWTTFAILSVAAGVATVVALRSLGLAIGDSLLVNLRELNRGDITIRTVGTGPFAFTVNQGDSEQRVFRPGQIARINDLVASYHGTLTTYSIYNNVQITAADFVSTGRPQFISTFFIDPADFTIGREVLALDPPGVPLADLLTGGRDVVISQNLAEEQNLHIGDPVRVTGTTDLFTVTGIVATETEANIRNITAAFFGFAYFDRDLAPSMQLNAEPNHISIVLPDGTPEVTIRQLGIGLWTLKAGVFTMNTTPDLLQSNAQLADMLGRFIVVLGLGALLIGGVGIVNTMLVMVGRRTLEIASLKTFGMKRHQIAALFSTEAVLLGLMGSALGIVIGLLLSLVVNKYGEALIQQKLTWRLYPEAAIFGFVMGMVITVIFGVLPVLIAARVRPAIILRPNQTHMASTSLFEVSVALTILIVVLGAITGQIVGPLLERALGSYAPNPILFGIVVVTAVLILLALLVGLLWLLVWFIGRLPAFGSVDLRLALRNMTARRTRTATTLLALSAGMFALSSISFFGLGARQILQFQFAETLGGNVMVVPLVRQNLGQTLVNILIALQDDIEYNTRMGAFFSRLEAVDDHPVQLDDQRIGVTLPLVIRESEKPDLRSGTLQAGRDLEPGDYGQPVVVLSEQSLIESALREFTLADLGVTVGSTVRMNINNRPYDLQVIGIVASANGIIPNFGGAFLPPGLIDINRAYAQFNILDIPPEKVNDVLLSLSQVPLLLAVDVTFLDSLMTRLIEQMSAIPTIVGVLSLAAAAVIMGNTVSLATLERRHQIGVLKAMGLKRGRVLRVMLLENTVIGLLGGLLGIAISSLLVALMTALGTGVPVPLPEEGRPLAIALLIASVLIAWAATFFSARVAVNERVSRVLHYE
ncbi:MAG: ABC transporter permease [Anaerolineae bacterium]|nr:ABC transporter permease [Anaerolineae bacterium]